MGYKDENIKHRQGVATHSHKCPHCGDKKRFRKIPFMLICSKCKKSMKGENLVKL